MVKILVVDDELDVLKVLSKELSVAGYDVVTATTGKQGIKQAQDTLPDLILMDILLPDIGGADAVKVIKSYPELKDKPVIFLTAMVTATEEQNDALKIHVGDAWYETVAKPYDKADLFSKIQKKLKVV
jgi:two-component system alkaline phosphatase synthesis response regulator PhoP